MHEAAHLHSSSDHFEGVAGCLADGAGQCACGKVERRPPPPSLGVRHGRVAQALLELTPDQKAGSSVWHHAKKTDKVAAVELEQRYPM